MTNLAGSDGLIFVGAAALGAAGGALGAHYLFNGGLKKNEAFTMGSRYFVSFLATIPATALTRDSMNGQTISENVRSFVIVAAFVSSFAFFTKAIKASDSKDTNGENASWKHQAAIGGASLLTSIVSGFVAILLLPKR